MGDVVKISAVYKAPALGFDGPDFMNCVLLVRSELSNTKLIKTALAIEKELGKTPVEGPGYSSRVIDIDILTIGDEQINIKNLEVPHPRMAERKFVLLPLQDIAPDFVHPKNNKAIQELLEACKDQSTLERQSKWLRNPKKGIQMDAHNYIAIEGNIGAGKTSLASMIAADFNAKLVLERFKDNPFLPKFYNDKSRYAFPLEMSFLADRYSQLIDDIAQYDLFKQFMVADYDMYKSLIFAKITLQNEEFALYKKLFSLMHKEMAGPDLYVYLYRKPERLLANIKKRGRDYEAGIDVSYLEQINAGYLEHIKSYAQDKVKIIDVTDLDFVANRADYLHVLDQIAAPLK